MYKKAFAIGFTLSLIILASAITPLFAQTLPKHDDNWYMVSKGVLDSDYYTLYPYDIPSFKSLNVGFSKYGELIGSPPSVPPDQVPPLGGQADWVGLDLAGVDPFANPDPLIPMERWINGWMIDIDYIHKSPQVRPDRHVWAMALFSDGGDWGYDWIKTTSPVGTPHGGRKTNTRVVTDPIKVIYNGPRRFVAQLTNHIYDQEPGLPDWKLVDLIITIDFNKVKHEVLLLKDIKMTIPYKDVIGKIDVEFSEREEWDLGPRPAFSSYAHFYEEELETCYGDEWHIAKQILRHWEGEKFGAGVTTYKLTDPGWLPYGKLPKTPVARDYEKVYVDGVLQRKPDDYSIDYAGGVITFTRIIPSTSKIMVKVKYVDKDPLPHLYDMAQFITNDLKYVGWAAYWPVVSQYTVDGWASALKKLINVKVADGSSEPTIPFLIAQWDFLLGGDPIARPLEYVPQYRGVEVKGVTDRRNADDADRIGSLGNIRDAEVMYQLDEVFNPWDLRQATSKDTKRWVQFEVGNAVTTDFPLDNTPVEVDSFWAYSGFPERVLINEVLQHRGKPNVLPNEGLINIHREYDLLYDPTTGKGTIHFYKPPPKDSVIKILYSTDTEYARTLAGLDKKYEQIWSPVRPGDVKSMIIPDSNSWTDPLGATHEIEFTKTITVELPHVTVAFEEAHDPVFTIGTNPAHERTGGYSEFANYLTANGYTVTTINPGTTITPSVLAPVDVLVIVAPQNSYSTPELDAIENWVKGGGKLLLIGQHDALGLQASTIAARFSIVLPQSMIYDSNDYVGGNTYWPYYDGANILSHPITTGVTRVEMYAGTGIASAPADEIPLIVTDTDGTATWEGGAPALGVSVMSALDGGTAGSGRLIVITDSNVWDSAYDTDGDGAINFYDSSNEILALNSVNWLRAWPALPTSTFEKVESWSAEDFKVYRDSTYQEKAVFTEPVAYEDEFFKVSTKLDITYRITAPLDETIHVKDLLKDILEKVTITYNTALHELDVTARIKVGLADPWYVEQIGGRYEWTIVGRDSAAVDSAGAGMVTAGYKNKQIEIGLTGLDMKDNKFGPRIPYVHRFWTGAGTDRYTYYDTLKQWDAVGRAALQDDYCHTWPISSSNIITVGGPAANLASEYWNDFTSAFMTGPYYSKDYPNFGLYSLGSWDYDFQQGVSAGGAWGFAIVSTYKDLNGTAGFIVWGWTGDDTYFITKWLHEPFLGYPSGLAYLQDMNPCATTIKIDINYSNHPPTVWIPRTLGTISEKPQHYDP